MGRTTSICLGCRVGTVGREGLPASRVDGGNDNDAYPEAKQLGFCKCDAALPAFGILEPWARSHSVYRVSVQQCRRGELALLVVVAGGGGVPRSEATRRRGGEAARRASVWAGQRAAELAT